MSEPIWLTLTRMELATPLEMPSRRRGVGDEEIVADDLDLAAAEIGQVLPAFPVVLGHAVLDRDDRVVGGEFCEILGLRLRVARLALAFIDVVAALEEFGGGAVEADRHLFAGLEAGLLDGAHDEVERGLGALEVRRKAALVADIGVVAAILEALLQRVEDFRAQRTASRRLDAPTGMIMNSWKSIGLSAWRRR